MNQIYIKPYCRIASYVMGMAAGWILYSYRQFAQSKETFDSSAVTISLGIVQDKVVRWTMFAFGLALVTFVIFIQTSAYASYKDGWNSWESWESAIFLGSDHILFSLGLTLMMLPILLGRFWFLRRLLSAHIWTPLARLTFCAFLVHGAVVSIAVYGTDSSFFWDSSSLALGILTMVIYSYMSAYVLYILVEMPVQQLKNLFSPKNSMMILEDENNIKVL